MIRLASVQRPPLPRICATTRPRPDFSGGSLPSHKFKSHPLEFILPAARRVHPVQLVLMPPETRYDGPSVLIYLGDCPPLGGNSSQEASNLTVQQMLG